ncbi:hypothetical protein ACPYO6_05690 [Georgenia sp. Z1344]|uniref:hypothetical protein n=1 Tax=Georgenia sp. Z1344 TaxID=3416706 RepID=UPI003CE8E340
MTDHPGLPPEPRRRALAVSPVWAVLGAALAAALVGLVTGWDDWGTARTAVVLGGAVALWAAGTAYLLLVVVPPQLAVRRALMGDHVVRTFPQRQLDHAYRRHALVETGRWWLVLDGSSARFTWTAGADRIDSPALGLDHLSEAGRAALTRAAEGCRNGEVGSARPDATAVPVDGHRVVDLLLSGDPAVLETLRPFVLDVRRRARELGPTTRS